MEIARVDRYRRNALRYWPAGVQAPKATPRMKRSATAPALVLAMLAATAPAADQPAGAPPEIPVAAFFRDPALDLPRMSPDGKEIAAIHSQDGVQYLIARPVDDEHMRGLLKAPNPDFRFQRVIWANDRTLLVSAQMRSPTAVGVRARASRLYAIERDGKGLRYLAQKWPDAERMQFQDHILSLLPQDPERVLIQYREPTEHWPTSMLLNVNNGALTHMGPRLEHVEEWYADRTGAVRVGAGQIEYSNTFVLYGRARPDADLDKIAEFQAKDDYYAFGGYSDDPSVIYLISDYELGRDAVYAYSLSEHRILKRVYAHEWADVAGLRYAPDSDHLIAVTYATDGWEEHWLDAEAEHEQQQIDAAAPNTRNVIVNQSADGTRAVLGTSSDTKPPIYWLYDRGKRRIDVLSIPYPKLVNAVFAPMQAISFQARDGVPIHGFLTLPVGRPQKQLPVIVLLHGGPRARDVRGWDPEVQLFANRGFAVLQVNFRGSTGYGREFLTSGDEQWGLKMQDDVTDAVRWLIARGTADPDRIGIYGGSYGGYAAMMGLVRTPELYRCGASYAGVMDLVGMLRDDDWYMDGRMIRELIGDPKADRDRLRETSPIENVARIRVPVLLAHGEDDGIVHVHQTQKMAKALAAAGKDVELMIFPDEIHGFKEERNRIEFYTRLVAFFERNLAPRTAPPAADGTAH